MPVLLRELDLRHNRTADTQTKDQRKPYTIMAKCSVWALSFLSAPSPLSWAIKPKVRIEYMLLCWQFTTTDH